MRSQLQYFLLDHLDDEKWVCILENFLENSLEKEILNAAWQLTNFPSESYNGEKRLEQF